MKNKKMIREFYFLGMSKEDLKDLVNKDLPININKLENIIDRIHDKYPMIDKSQISFIVRAVFESIRDFLILGYNINLRRFILNMKLHFFTYITGDAIKSVLRVKLKTPKIRSKK